MAQFRKVVVGPKIDLDTCGAILCVKVGNLLASEALQSVEVARTGRASETDLADPSVLCIEVGGSGRVDEGNFDHHEEDGPTDSAALQAYACIGGLVARTLADDVSTFVLGELVRFIHRLDTEGVRALPPREEGVYLSDLFAGMLLTERDASEQVRKGVSLLAKFLRERGDYVLQPISEWELVSYSADWPRWWEAKRENNRALAETLKRASWGQTQSGRRIAWLESNFFGAPGALYAHGAEIAVVFNPAFGNPPVRKFTVAGNSVSVNGCLERLNALEPGWGGPATGTILGSPREGSVLTLEQVVEVVLRETL